MTETTVRDDGALRQSGRTLLVAIHGAQRALKLYPVENAAVQRALDDLQNVATVVCAREGSVELKLASDFLFINQTRLRIGLDNFAAFSGFVSLMKDCGVGRLRVDDGVTRGEWQSFLSILATLPAAADPGRTARAADTADATGRRCAPRGRAPVGGR